MFENADRVSDFHTFCNEQLKIISPDLVVVSGDITDSKVPYLPITSQYKKEWDFYENIVNTILSSTKIKWLDLRGNHDAFDVISFYDQSNLFRQHSVDAKVYLGSYIWTLKKEYGNYSFIIMDNTPNPGVKYPYNYFGILPKNFTEIFTRFTSEATLSNLTFWVGHYPTSTIISPAFDIRSFISHTAVAFLCGHLHTLLNLFPEMYSLQSEGFLELELSDWKSARKFRIVAIDNDLVSFRDFTFSASDAQWPIILITNPKTIDFLLPHKEPINRILSSTHIRILVWSRSKIRSVSVYIDDNYMGNAMLAEIPNKPSLSQVTVPLFVLPWTPNHWLTTLPQTGHPAHWIKVIAEDEAGNQKSTRHYFTVDENVAVKWKPYKHLFLIMNLATLMQVLFYIIWLIPFTLIVIPRLLNNHKFSSYTSHCGWFGLGLSRIVNSRPIFSSLLLYFIYILFGPIFFGYAVDNYFAIFFSYGIYTINRFVPDYLVYFIETLHFLFYVYPSLLIIIWRASRRPICLFHRIDMPTILLICITIVQMISSVFLILIPYGVLAFFLSPGRLGIVCVIWFAYLHSQRTTVSSN